MLVGRIEPNGPQVPDVVNLTENQTKSFDAGTMDLIEVGVAC